MKEIVEYLSRKNLIYKSFKLIAPKLLNIRSRVGLFSGTDSKGYYSAVFVIEQKSRVLQVNVDKVDDYYRRLVEHEEHNFKYKIIIIKAPLCSKAKVLFKQRGWRVFHDFV